MSRVITTWMKKMWALVLAGLGLVSLVRAGEGLPSQWFDGYAPGVIAADEGTVELTLTFSRPITEFGNSFDFAFQMSAVRPTQHSGPTVLGLLIPAAPFPSQGLTVVARDAEQSAFVSAENFSPAVGQPIRVAFSWGKGSVDLYVDGALAGTTAFARPLGPMPAAFQVMKLDPFGISEIKISDIKLSGEQLATNAKLAMGRELHTTFLVTDGDWAGARYFSSQRAQAERRTDLVPLWSMEEQVAMEGDTPIFPLVGVNHSKDALDFEVHFDVRDHRREPAGVFTRTVRVDPDGQPHVTRLPLPELSRQGFYSLRSTVLLQGSASEKRTYHSTIAVMPRADARTKDGALAAYLGHHFPIADHSPVVMQRLGIQNERIFEDLSGFYWFAVEPQPGRFTWERTDVMVERARKTGMDLLGILGNPPPWAAVDPGEAHKRRFASHATMSGRWRPRDLAEWDNYVYQVVSRYKGSVRHWEIWNEVDWHPPGEALSFSGSTQHYFELLKVAYAAAKRADPHCLVAISGFGLIPAPKGDPEMPYDLLKMGAAEHLDLFNVHAYIREPAEKLAKIVRREHPEKPIWMTEQMFDHVADAPTRHQLMVGIYLSFLEQGFTRFYQFGNASFSFDRFTHSPALDTYVMGVFQRHFRASETLLGRVDVSVPDALPIAYRFRRSDGLEWTVLGGANSTVHLRIDGALKSAISLYGETVEWKREQDVVTLPVDNVVYLVSEGPLRVSGIETESARDLIENGGFENVRGDVATGGIDAGIPLAWTPYSESVRAKLSDESKTGRYSLRIDSGNGVEQRLMPMSPGVYEVSMHVRRANASAPAEVLVVLDDGSRGVLHSRSLMSDEFTDEFTEIRWEVPVSQMSVGALRLRLVVVKGAVLFDDVSVTPAHLEKTN